MRHDNASHPSGEGAASAERRDRAWLWLGVLSLLLLAIVALGGGGLDVADTEYTPDVSDGGELKLPQSTG